MIHYVKICKGPSVAQLLIKIYSLVKDGVQCSLVHIDMLGVLVQISTMWGSGRGSDEPCIKTGDKFVTIKWTTNKDLFLAERGCTMLIAPY